MYFEVKAKLMLGKGSRCGENEKTNEIKRPRVCSPPATSLKKLMLGKLVTISLRYEAAR
jgi:hypothetical protein